MTLSRAIIGIALTALVAVMLVTAVPVCREERAPPPPRELVPLARYLEQVLNLRDREFEIGTWLMDRATWNRIVVPPFTALYDDHHREFEQARVKLVRVKATGPRETRRHFAGDAALTLGQARARWLLPPLFPSQVAVTNNEPIDVVFVPDGDRWYVLTGIDRILRAQVDRLDPACGALIDEGDSKVCRDAAFAVATAALRTDPTRFQHACAIAKTACAKSSQ